MNFDKQVQISGAPIGRRLRPVSYAYRTMSFAVMVTWLIINIASSDGNKDTTCDYDIKKQEKECRKRQEIEYNLGNFWYYICCQIAILVLRVIQVIVFSVALVKIWRGIKKTSD